MKRTPEQIEKYNAARRLEYLNDSEVKRERNRLSYAKHRESRIAAVAAYRKANPELVAACSQRWRDANPGRNCEGAKAWAGANPERAKAKLKAWRASNPDYRKQRYAADITFRIAASLREKLRKAVKAAGLAKQCKTLDLVGCSRSDLRNYLAAQFLNGMSWENCGAWHIDHIRPVCTFDLSDPVQQRAAFHFTNLRPLWAADNLSRPRKNWQPDHGVSQ